MSKTLQKEKKMLKKPVVYNSILMEIIIIPVMVSTTFHYRSCDGFKGIWIGFNYN